LPVRDRETGDNRVKPDRLLWNGSARSTHLLHVADEALTAFVQEHGGALLRVAYLLCRDGGRAEDIVQDALVKVMRRWRTVGAADSPLAYARRTVVNEYLSWRRLRAAGEVVGVVAESAAPDRIGEVDERDVVWRLMGTLQPRARAVLVLRYYDQLPDSEIATLLGCAEASVRSTAARALTALRTNPMLAAVTEEG
jgi:RNA polymerase sigma-70 factor (sigma-E family)